MGREGGKFKEGRQEGQSRRITRTHASPTPDGHTHTHHVPTLQLADSTETTLSKPLEISLRTVPHSPLQSFPTLPFSPATTLSVCRSAPASGVCGHSADCTSAHSADCTRHVEGACLCFPGRGRRLQSGLLGAGERRVHVPQWRDHELLAGNVFLPGVVWLRHIRAESGGLRRDQHRHSHN